MEKAGPDSLLCLIHQVCPAMKYASFPFPRLSTTDSHNLHFFRVRIQKEFISDLMRKNEEIRGKRLGQLQRSTGNAIPKQGLNGAIQDG